MGNQEHYFKSFLIGGLLMGGLSAVPGLNLGSCCCLWQLLGGGMAAWVLCRSASNPVRPGEGALVGIFSGMIGAMIFSLVTAATYFWNPEGMNFSMREIFQDQGPQLPPQVQAALEEGLRWLAHPGTSLVILLFFSLLFFAIMAMVGALISVTVFEPRFAVTRGKMRIQTSFAPRDKIQAPETAAGQTDLQFPRKKKEDE